MRFLHLVLVAGCVGTSVVAQPVDLALVLAVDVSNSMTADEQEAQRSGYVEAFRHPALVAAVRSGTLKRISVSYLEWAGPSEQRLVLPWTVVDGPESSERVAAELERVPIGRGHGTSMSAALAASAALLQEQESATRRAIDISGDGQNNAGTSIQSARDKVAALGITVNGLPIHLTHSHRNAFHAYSSGALESYFTHCVIVGIDAFVVPVKEPGDLADAIRRKLIREIAGSLPVVQKASFSTSSVIARSTFDCSAPGEVPLR